MAPFDPTQHLTQVLDDLEARRIRFALVGGVALGTYVEPRFTKDLDFSVALSDERSQDGLVRELKAARYREESLLVRRSNGDVIGIRFYTPDTESREPNLDLLFAATGIEEEIIRDAEPIKVFGRTIPTATISDLIAMKTLSSCDRGGQDSVDLENLLEKATSGEIRRARQRLDLITERGRNAGYDLARQLDEHLKRARQRDD